MIITVGIFPLFFFVLQGGEKGGLLVEPQYHGMDIDMGFFLSSQVRSVRSGQKSR